MGVAGQPIAELTNQRRLADSACPETNMNFAVPLAATDSNTASNSAISFSLPYNASDDLMRPEMSSMSRTNRWI
jgi:hypothetical protein